MINGKQVLRTLGPSAFAFSFCVGRSFASDSAYVSTECSLFSTLFPLSHTLSPLSHTLFPCPTALTLDVWYHM